MGERRSSREEQFGWLGADLQEAPAQKAAESGEIPGVDGPPKRRRNRVKTGKRSNPEYMMAGAYIRKKVRQQVTHALSAQGKEIEYSQLVERLLVRWLSDVGYSLEDTGEDNH